INKMPGYYAPERLLSSGWIIGEEKLYNKACIADVNFGSGRIILIGFRAQHRAQTYASFKILFNSIFLSGSEK
ncbi:hypothetical protein DRQ09_10520, partial [candidate division KSB1 bacterium]